MKINEIELDQSDLNTLHDVIFNALEIEDLTNEQLLEYWKLIPEHIKMDALKWGIDDTPTRNAIYVWLQKNYK